MLHIIMKSDISARLSFQTSTIPLQQAYLNVNKLIFINLVSC